MLNADNSNVNIEDRLTKISSHLQLTIAERRNYNLRSFSKCYLSSRETTSDGRPYHQDATGQLANHAMSWTPRGSGRRRGRPTKTWRSTFKEDLVDRGVDWNSVRAVATNRGIWRTLAAHCPVKDRRISVLSKYLSIYFIT